MQPADDVELAGRHPPSLVRFREDLLERPGIRPVLLGHPGERAEHAGVAENADVGRIDVLVGGEEDPVAVAAPVGRIGEEAESEQVGGPVERHTLGGVQALPCLHLCGDRVEGRVAKAGQVDLTGHRISLRYTQ